MSIEIIIIIFAILIILFLLNMLVKNLQQRVKELEKYQNAMELKEFQTELNKKLHKANIYKVENGVTETQTFDLTFENGDVETYNIEYEQTNT
jgi:predicted PurR-regulated permease PerM